MVQEANRDRSLADRNRARSAVPSISPERGLLGWTFLLIGAALMAAGGAFALMSGL
jgi:hypothetical protein